MPYSRLQTDFRDMSNRPFNGSMLAVLNAPIKLPEGVEILNQRFEYPVKDGVAYDDDTLTVIAELPATATATPDDTLVSIFLKDASGRLFYHGAFVIPEMTNNVPIQLAALSNQDPTGGVVLNVASIGGLTGTVLVAGQVAIDQNTNTITFHGLRFKGPWDGDSQFVAGDVVLYQNDLWCANRTNQGSQPAPSADWSLFLEQPPVVLPAPTGINWRNAWQTGTTYRELDAVEYQGQAYVCLQVHQAAASNAPTDGSAYWKLFAAKGVGINWQGAWDNTRTYKKGDGVQYQGSSYYATADMPAGNAPGSTQAPLPAGNVAAGNGGSVVGTGSTANHGPENAFDGNAATYWEASTGSGYFDTVGLANVWGGVLREITQVVIRQHDTDYHNKVGGILIEYTQDAGVTWQDAVAGVQGIPNGGFGEQIVVLPSSVMANGMRVKAGAGTTAGGSSYPWRIYGLKFLANALPGAPFWDLIAQKGADGAGVGNLSLNDLGDVDTTGASDGQVLKRQGGVWVPSADNAGTPGATTLDGLSDVTTIGVNDGDILIYDAGAGTWHPEAPQAPGAGNLDGLSDVALLNPQAGQVLKFDGTSWTNQSDATGSGGASTLDGLSDVTIESPAAKHTLVHDGTDFKNRQLTLADLADVDLAGAATGKVLEYNAGTGKWAPGTDDTGGGTEVYPQLRVSATKTASQAIAANQTSQTIVVFDNEVTDVAGEYNSATGRFTAATAGEYIVYAHVEPKRDTSGANNIGVGVSKNGASAEWVGRYAQNGELSWQSATQIQIPLTLAANDTVDVVVRTGQASTIQADGTIQSGINTASRCWLKVYKLS